MKCKPQKTEPIHSLLISVLLALCLMFGTAHGETAPPAAGAADLKGIASPKATQLQSVYAARQGKGLKVFVGADGTIEEYKAFTTSEPPQIIFDLFNLKSPYDHEKVIPVNSEWVKQIRYTSEPDKVRLILETRMEHLSAYKANTVENGLLIQVGSGADQLAMKPALAAPAETAAKAPETAPKSPPPGSAPAGITQIDFISAGDGKSVMVVGTTRPVRYETKKIGENRLELRLLDASLPPQRQRPLITDRFESAVDEIVPRAGTNAALFDITLREAVPYAVDQEGSSLKVRFDASTVPPKPLTGIAAAQESRQAADPPRSIAKKSVKPVPVASMALAPESGPAGVAMAGPGPMAPPQEMNLDLDEELGVLDDIPTYTGEKIALDFYETEIKNVFRILREVSGKNFAVDKDVTGKVTLTLAEPVPWDQILDLVLKMNKLGKTREGSIIRIATRATLAEEERVRQEKRTAELAARDQQQQLEPLFTEYLPVNYSNAGKEIKPHVEKLLTKDRGNVSVDERTNMIILTDTKEKISRAKELISKLDRVTPQVLIEGRVVEATTNFTKEIGTTWQTGLGVEQTGTGVVQTPNESVINIGGATEDVTTAVNNRVGVGPQNGYDALGGTYGYNVAVDFPIAAANYGSLGFNFMRIAGTPFLLNAKLHAMESQGEAKIVSAPKVVTLDNKKAVIKQGISYPYQTVENGEVNVEFKDVDLLLEVTPHVTPDSRISMNINITKNDLGDVIAGQQSFTTKEAQTELLVNDGDTVVIGGIIKTASRQDLQGIPYLNKVPVLGWLFKAEGSTDQKEELLIFITPRIIQLEQRLVKY